MNKLEKHSFYECVVNDYQNELNWAKETAVKKVSNTIDTWQNRTDCKRFTNLFLGDLAKNILKSFLCEYVPNIDNNIEEYDRVRTDAFKHSDQYDLKIFCNKKECNIEVKSSGEKFTKNLTKIYDRRIIINIGNVHSHIDCIYTQVIFIPDDLTFFANDDIKYCPSFESFVNEYMEKFKKMNIKAYITAYANKDMQIKAINKVKTFNVENVNAGAEPRKYAELIIRDGKTPDQLIENAKKFCRNEINGLI